MIFWTYLFILIAALSPEIDIPPHHYKMPCEVQFEGIDMTTKMYRLELAPIHFFKYTPPEIKNELKQNNLLEVQGHVLKMDKQVYLDLNASIYSKKAKTFYGSIEPGYILKITLLNDREIELVCEVGSKGQWNNQEGSYIYPIRYSITPKQLKLLSRSEIDKTGIQWSSGYEEYTVYEVDFMLNQIKCLNNPSKKRS